MGVGEGGRSGNIIQDNAIALYVRRTLTFEAKVCAANWVEKSLRPAPPARTSLHSFRLAVFLLRFAHSNDNDNAHNDDDDPLSPLPLTNLNHASRSTLLASLLCFLLSTVSLLCSPDYPRTCQGRRPLGRLLRALPGVCNCNDDD